MEGSSIRSLLADPKSAWGQPAITTFHFKNHAVRANGSGYIRYKTATKNSSTKPPIGRRFWRDRKESRKKDIYFEVESKWIRYSDGDNSTRKALEEIKLLYCYRSL
ncbi:MAG: hypothetical protein EXS38_10585 [Opitutus sp.]|nr:hypothetical protein [Opitutus sp.]